MRNSSQLLALLCVCVLACSNDGTGPIEQLDDGQSYFPDAAWRTASAEGAGFDPARIRDIERGIAGDAYGDVDGVVVIRNGYMVIDEYNGWNPAAAHTIQSVTKSVTSLLVGILAASDSRVRADAPLLPFFSDYPEIANLDDRKRAITLHHMLSMRTSMDFWEQPYAGSPLDQLNSSSGDWVKFVLDRPMTGAPGSAWGYNSGAPIVMCGLIRELTGDSVQGFARRTLFRPIGITSDWWFRSPYDGLAHCGGGLNLTARDLARIGYLVLRDGRWGDQQIVSEEWLRESFVSRSQGSEIYLSNGYGYYWWLFPTQLFGSDRTIIGAVGAGGNYLFIVPDRDIVVAMIASNGMGEILLYDVLEALR